MSQKENAQSIQDRWRRWFVLPHIQETQETHLYVPLPLNASWDVARAGIAEELKDTGNFLVPVTEGEGAAIQKGKQLLHVIHRNQTAMAERLLLEDDIDVNVEVPGLKDPYTYEASPIQTCAGWALRHYNHRIMQRLLEKGAAKTEIDAAIKDPQTGPQWRAMLEGILEKHRADPARAKPVPAKPVYPSSGIITAPSGQKAEKLTPRKAVRAMVKSAAEGDWETAENYMLQMEIHQMQLNKTLYTYSVWSIMMRAEEATQYLCMTLPHMRRQIKNTRLPDASIDVIKKIKYLFEVADGDRKPAPKIRDPRNPGYLTKDEIDMLMIQAMEKGDWISVRKWLLQGADPYLRSAAEPYYSATDLAVRGGDKATALLLLLICGEYKTLKNSIKRNFTEETDFMRTMNYLVYVLSFTNSEAYPPEEDMEDVIEGDPGPAPAYEN